jgi:hypothetical protein
MWADKGNGDLRKRRASKGRIPRGNSKEKYIFEFQRLEILARFENCHRDVDGIWMQGLFLNSSRIL